MARLTGVLTDIQVRHWIKAGAPVAKSDGAGLTFTLSSTGTASWVLRYRIGGKQKELTLGNYPDMTLAKARQLASVERVAVQQGVDVAQAKQEQKVALSAAGSVKELCEEYFERMVKGRIKRPDLVKDMLDKDIVCMLGKFRIADVKPVDVDRMVAGIVRRGSPVMANRVLTTTKSVFDYAIRRHWIEHNPAAAFTRRDAGGEEVPRRRALEDTEITLLLKAFNVAGPVFRPYALAVRLLLLTAVRRSELVLAPWSEFDFERALWVISSVRQKTGGKSGGQDFTVPLTPLALAWLKELKMISCGSDYVFPAKRRGVRVTLAPETLNWALAQIDHGLEHFTIHDLRRTARTHLAMLGVKPHIAERCLNHRLPGINDIYDRHDYLDERRDAMLLWDGKLRALDAASPVQCDAPGATVTV